MGNAKFHEYWNLYGRSVASHGFLRNIDNTYYTNIETMLGLTPSGSNYLTEGPGGRGLVSIMIVIIKCRYWN